MYFFHYGFIQYFTFPTFLPFSDSNWNWVDEDTKSVMQMEKKPDGEFWMNFKEFCRQFQEVTICTLGPDFDGDGEADQIGG